MAGWARQWAAAAAAAVDAPGTVARLRLLRVAAGLAVLAVLLRPGPGGLQLAYAPGALLRPLAEATFGPWALLPQLPQLLPRAGLVVAAALALLAIAGWAPRVVLPGLWLAVLAASPTLLWDGPAFLAATLAFAAAASTVDVGRLPAQGDLPAAGWAPRLIVAVLAFGYTTAATVKLVTPAWRDGQIISSAVARVPTSRLAVELPPTVVSVASWVVPAGLLVVAVALLAGRWQVALVGGLAFHGSIAVALHVGMFSVVALCCYLPVLADRPALSVHRCGRRIVERVPRPARLLVTVVGAGALAAALWGWTAPVLPLRGELTVLEAT